MQITTIELPELFSQLGLANTDFAITRFIKSHPLPESIKLTDADFWSDAQRQFLRESWQQDSDWCVAVDTLNVLLHQQAAA